MTFTKHQQRKQPLDPSARIARQITRPHLSPAKFISQRREQNLIPLIRKQCSKCQQVLPKISFFVSRHTKTGLRSHCKSCTTKETSARQRYLYKCDPGYRVLMLSQPHLKPEVRQKRADYAKTERGKAQAKAYRQSEKGKATLKAYQRTEKYKNSRVRWYAKTIDSRRAYSKLLYRKWGKAYDKQRKSTEKHKAWRRAYMAKYMLKPEHRLAHNMRTRLGAFISKKKRSDETLQLLGCDVLTFMAWLQQHFAGDMSWSNYGTVWNLDHRIPMKAFDLNRADARRKCCHHTNIFPMLVEQNGAKGDLMPDGSRARFTKSLLATAVPQS